jgi:hypothetical protein
MYKTESRIHLFEILGSPACFFVRLEVSTMMLVRIHISWEVTLFRWALPEVWKKSCSFETSENNQ